MKKVIAWEKWDAELIEQEIAEMLEVDDEDEELASDAMALMKSSHFVVVPSRMESLPTTIKEAFFFKEITTALTNKKRVEIRGFGAFYTKDRQKRVGLNPQNGKNIEIDEKTHPKFRMGKILFKKLNSK